MEEAKMTDADMAQREKIVKSMKKNFKDFRSRYGSDAKSVMYATATKMAMKEEETIDEALFYNPSPSHSPKAKNPKEKMSKELRKKINYFRKKYGVEAKPKMAMKEEETIEENKYSLPAGSMKPEKPVKAKSYLEKRFGHLKPGQSASLKGDPKQVKKTNEEAIEEGEVKKANKEKKNKYVASIIQKKIHPSLLPSTEYGRRKLKEAVKDEADKGEYDYEGDMAKSSLRTIIRNAQMMHDMLDENTNLPEWVASKITLAEDYLVSAAQYMQSEMSEEVKLEEGNFDNKLPAGVKPKPAEGPSLRDKLRDPKFREQYKKDLKKKYGIKEKVEQVDEISSYKASRAADASWHMNTRNGQPVAQGYKKLRHVDTHPYPGKDGKLGSKSREKSEKQYDKFRSYAKKKKEMGESNLTPYRNTELGVRSTKKAGLPRMSNAKQFWRPPEGFTKKGIEKGKGKVTVPVYKKKK